MPPRPSKNTANNFVAHLSLFLIMNTLQLPKVIIHNSKTDAILRFHPWIFSGAVKSKDGTIKNDTLVEVVNERGKFLAIGYFTESNIAVRILSFTPIESLQQLFEEKISNAFEARKIIGLTNSATTNAYRLIHAEGDGIPGLIIDFYNGVCVVQAHSVFIAKQMTLIADCLQKVYGDKHIAVYNKSNNTLPKHNEYGKDEFVFGTAETLTVKENENSFRVDFITGQKTGFFIDQRENRKLLATYSKGKKVLNTFCYTGGFSVYAAKANAEKVVSVDSSEKAMVLTDQNIALNGCEAIHESVTSDVFDYLRTVKKGDFDVIVLDPPAFAKNVAARHHAIQAYKRINLEAMQKLEKGGILFTFSCSQVVNYDLFRGAVTAAAIEAGKNIRILHQLTQPPDHPINIFHPEGNYLKGLVLLVN